MPDKQAITRYRHWYRKLLGLYAKPYRERFAEGMEQTFNDLCRERAAAGRGLGGFVLWMFAETAAGIFKQHARSIIMQKSLIRVTIGTGLLLLVPLLGSMFVEGWNWTPFDFMIAGALVFGTGLTFELIAKRVGSFAYRAAVGIACVTGFLLVFINAAVGIIGDGPVNLLYFGVIAVGFAGALLARFEPRGMSWALVATAVAQMLVPVIALMILRAGGQELLMDLDSPHGPFSPGIAPVFGLNAVFATLWIASALLFRHAAGPLAQQPVHSS